MAFLQAPLGQNGALLAVMLTLVAVPVLASDKALPLPRLIKVELKAGGLAEECLRMERGQTLAFEWESDSPVEFNIHFHRGKEVIYPVRVDGSVRHRGRFTASSDEDYCWMWTAGLRTTVRGSIYAEGEVR